MQKLRGVASCRNVLLGVFALAGSSPLDVDSQYAFDVNLLVLILNARGVDTTRKPVRGAVSSFTKNLSSKDPQVIPVHIFYSL